MSGEFSRSSLIDVTYFQLHNQLRVGGHEGIRPNQIKAYLEPRKKQLGNVIDTFGTPSDTSKQIINSGSVTLSDGVALRVEEGDKEFILALSLAFQIDEIQAFILLRSFLYNEGMPSKSDNVSFKAALVDAIQPFYFSEVISSVRVLIPLFRAKENEQDQLHEIAVEFLPQIIPDGTKFVESVISQYMIKATAKLPEECHENPRKASLWAKNNLKEQLILLEILLWIMMGYVPASSRLVVSIFRAAYSTRLGSKRDDITFVVDEETLQIQEDCAAIWILITIEVLELEDLGMPNNIELSDLPSRKEMYFSSPDALKELHDIVISNPDSEFSCTYLAWTYVLSRLLKRAQETNPISDLFKPFFDHVSSTFLEVYSNEQESLPYQMAHMCLGPDVGFLSRILQLLTTSPIFVTSIAQKKGSSITDSNANAYRSILKGLIIGLLELVPVEMMPDFDVMAEVWIALFGRSESEAVAGMCLQFWESDLQHSMSRRALFEAARLRFPIQMRPLLKLLRAMAGVGFSEIDPLYNGGARLENNFSKDREACVRHVCRYFSNLTSYTQVIPLSACSGSQAMYERQTDRGSQHAELGLTYVNLRPIRLPGGIILPAGITGRLLTAESGDYVAIGWRLHHSGWNTLLEILTDYVNRRSLDFGRRIQGIPSNSNTATQVRSLRISDIGMEFDQGGDEDLIIDILDLIQGVIQDNPPEAASVVVAIEEGEPVVSHQVGNPSDLVQLTTMILEEALSRSNLEGRGILPSLAKLITSALNVLTALLALPAYSNRVWLFVRSTSALFGGEREPGFATFALAAERTSGQYIMTSAILKLVNQLFHEASLTFRPELIKLQDWKEGVLLNAARFVHTEIWVEHMTWKFLQVGDRFEISSLVINLYVQIFEASPPTLRSKPFPRLSQSIADALLFNATTSTINPLASTISTGRQTLQMLLNSQRLHDINRLVVLLQKSLRLVRLILSCKSNSNMAFQPCLLEQALCARVTGGAPSHDKGHTRFDPIDVLASYVTLRDIDPVVPTEATNVLCALVTSLSDSQTSPPTIIGHLSNPKSTIAAFVHIVQHPYDELALRKSIWNFATLAVDKEPALATLFITGKSRTPGEFQEVTEKSKKAGDSRIYRSALDAACDILVTWKDLWDSNPLLLACVFRFLFTVWQHAVEHNTVVDPLRKRAEFWERVVAAACEEVGPVPTYETVELTLIDGIRHSTLHENVQTHAYRNLVKSYAVQIISRDIALHLQLHRSETPVPTPESYLKLEPFLKSEDQLNDLLSEAAPSSYAPELYDQLSTLLSTRFSGLKLEEIEDQSPELEREYGDTFIFSTSMLRVRLHAFPLAEDSMDDPNDEAEKLATSINLNLSLVHSERALLESLNGLIKQTIPFLKTESVVRPNLLNIAATTSYAIALEKRQGSMMAAIHGERLALVLSLLEAAWFSLRDKKPEVDSFSELMINLRNIILNEAQSPARSILSSLPSPFHRVLLQIIYFCAKYSRNLLSRPDVLNAKQRIDISQTVEAILAFVIDGLSIVFVAARNRADVDLDFDMELLVAAFEQCTRKDINSSIVYWLTKCQETDIIRSSLELYNHIDLVGLSDLTLLLARKQPLYAPHVLLFHMALASNPAAAERLASDGILAAYSNNFISSAISSGMIDIALPELPSVRSPAHLGYCSMIAIVSTIINALGRQNHYFDVEACGFVQLYDEQMSRALLWTIGDPITLPLLEEIDQTVHLFYAIASSVPNSANSNPNVDNVLRSFTNRALNLLQQVNYAITHPNHLASLYEPLTTDEKAKYERAQKVADPMKRPYFSHLVHRLYQLASNIIGTLITISRADVVLSRGVEDWPISEALIVPHSKIVLGEPASLGTLLELGNRTLDVLRNLVQRPPVPGLSDPSAPLGSYTTALSVKKGVITARRTLEEILLYSATQLAMWLSKPDFNVPHDSVGDMAVDDEQLHQKRTVARSTSITMAERLRRGMTGEMAGDLQILLTRSKPFIAASDTIIGKSSVDISLVLLNFLHERIGRSS